MTREITLSDLHCVAEWEMNNPGYQFEHIFYYKDTHFVRKVIGRVKIRKRRSDGMGGYHFRETTKKVRWDGLGHCYCGNDSHRNRDYDIHF